MVPPYSHRVSRVRRYSGFSWLLSVFAYETFTLFGGPSHVLLLTFSIPSAVRTPKVLLLSVWPLPRSLATTCGISVDFFSSPYLDFRIYFLLCSVFKVRSVSFPLTSFGLNPTKPKFCRIWWAQVDSNHRPHAYQACALTT